MKLKSVAVVSASLLAISARAEGRTGEISYLSLSSPYSENLFRASLLMAGFSEENSPGSYQIRLNREKNILEVQFQKQEMGSKLDELIGRLTAEFGDSLNIEKVDINSITNASQDGWM